MTALAAPRHAASRQTMSAGQWQEELISHLNGTDWFVAWSGIIDDLCSADLRHRLTRETTAVYLYWHPLKTPRDFKYEIQNQLNGVQHQ